MVPSHIFAHERSRVSFSQGLKAQDTEKNKHHLSGSIHTSFHFGSDQQAEVLLGNFTLKQFKALDGLYITRLSGT